VGKPLTITALTSPGNTAFVESLDIMIGWQLLQT